MKICSKCKIEQSLENYTKDSKKSDGKSMSCKSCDQVYYLSTREEKSKKAKESYLKDSSVKRNYYLKNRDRIRARHKQYNVDHKLEIRQHRQSSYLENKEEVCQARKVYYKLNKDKVDARTKAYLKQYIIYNKPKLNAKSAKRRADKILRTPSWLTEFDFDYMEHLYTQARELTILTGVEHEVDHILPLKGTLVSGFHCPKNLQIITRAENRSKINKLVEI